MTTEIIIGIIVFGSSIGLWLIEPKLWFINLPISIIGCAILSYEFGKLFQKQEMGGESK